MALRKFEMEGKNKDKKDEERKKDKDDDMETNIQQTYFFSVKYKKERLEVVHRVPGKTDRILKKICPQEGVEIGR